MKNVLDNFGNRYSSVRMCVFWSVGGQEHYKTI